MSDDTRHDTCRHGTVGPCPKCKNSTLWQGIEVPIWKTPAWDLTGPELDIHDVAEKIRTLDPLPPLDVEASPGSTIAQIEFGEYGQALTGATMTYFTTDTTGHFCTAVLTFDDWRNVGGSLEVVEAFRVDADGNLTETDVDEARTRKEFLYMLFHGAKYR